MKKVKIMLTAIAVFAVVGGALAFKTKALGYHLYRCNTALNQCLEPNNKTYTIDDVNGSSTPSATVTNIDPGSVPCTVGRCTTTIKITTE